MIIQTIQIIGILIALTGLFSTISRFRSRSSKPLVSLLWLLVWTSLLVVSIIPELTSYIASVAGIGRGSDLVVYLSILFICHFLFRLNVRLEDQNRTITSIVQKLALENSKENSKRKK